ncbi:DUF4446 family protein [Clostridiaceae bacterium 35-E11]
MEILFTFIKQNQEMIVLYSAMISVGALIALLIQGLKLSRLEKKYQSLSQNMEGKNLEEIIYQYYEKIDNLDIQINQITGKIEEIQENLLHCVQKIGMVQYNAFEDVGGNLSFSIALLDKQNNGFIVSSLYSRNNHVVYGKPIKKGKATQNLSAEEVQAIDRAKHNSLDEYIKIMA